MAVLKSAATGNWTSAATWALVDSTSYNNTENTTTALTTSYTTSSTFTPGAITIDGIAVKLSVRTGTTGTISVALDLATVTVAGTEVTINTADLPVAATADLNGGWHYFKFAAPVLLVAATAYGVKARTSSASQVSLFSTATTNWARALVTTTTQAPVAGDDMIVAGEYTGAGTSNSFTVTMNQTATTDYGAASTSLVLPALAICNKGTLTWGTTAATNYNLKISGNLIVYSGGTYSQGTTGTPCPRDSSMKLQFDCVANVDFGFVARNLATVNLQGLSRTSGKDIYVCRLNTDEAVAQTVLGVDTDTGWLNADEIGIAATSRTSSDTERRVLSGAAGASSMTVTAGLTNAHLGTSPNQAEVILLTRNVSIFGVSVTVQTYIDIKATATVDVDWAEFYFMGSNTASKRGIEVATTTGNCAFSYCSFHDFTVTGSVALWLAGGGSGNNYTAEFCVFYDIVQAIVVSATSGTSYTINEIYMLRGTGAGATTLFNIADVGGTITNIYAVGCTAGVTCVTFSENAASVGTINNIYLRSNTSGMSLVGMTSSGTNDTISNITVRRISGTTGLTISNLSRLTLSDVTLIANLSNMTITSLKNVTLTNGVIAADSSFSSSSGVLTSASTGGDMTFENTTFGVGTAHTQDILCVAMAFTSIRLQNCLLSSGTEVASQTLLPDGVSITSQKHDQTAGLHRSWYRFGTITIDTTAGLFDATPSMRITPNNASSKMEAPIFRSAVTNGSTLSITVKVRESVAGDGTDYNGNRIRLVLKRNAAAGISADTVLATATVASVGAFETLSGTTASVTDDAILEFCIDCDGTTGWVNVDTVTVTTQTNTKGLAYWKDGVAFSYGDNSSGGGGAVTTAFTFS